MRILTMPRPRSAHRNHSDFELWSADTSEGYRVIKHVAFAYGESRVARGEWRRVFDELTGAHKGYQAVAPRHDVTASSDASRAALAPPEMKANAGLLGRSRTGSMKPGDPRRIGRVHPKSGRLLPAEDFIERTQELVKLYPRSANFRTGDRAVRVYPKAPLEQR